MEIEGIWISEDVWLDIFGYIGWEDLFKSLISIGVSFSFFIFHISPQITRP
jgi:hypothetical protein